MGSSTPFRLKCSNRQDYGMYIRKTRIRIKTKLWGSEAHLKNELLNIFPISISCSKWDVLFFLILNHFIGDDKVIHRCYLTAEANIRLRMDKAIAEKEITEFVKFYCYSLITMGQQASDTISPVSWASNQSRSPSSPPLSHLRKREETSQTAVLPCPSPI